MLGRGRRYSNASMLALARFHDMPVPLCLLTTHLWLPASCALCSVRTLGRPSSLCPALPLHPPRNLHHHHAHPAALARTHPSSPPPPPHTHGPPATTSPPTFRDVAPELERLKVKAIARCRDFLMDRIYDFRKPKTNVQVWLCVCVGWGGVGVHHAGGRVAESILQVVGWAGCLGQLLACGGAWRSSECRRAGRRPPAAAASAAPAATAAAASTCSSTSAPATAAAGRRLALTPSALSLPGLAFPNPCRSSRTCCSGTSTWSRSCGKTARTSLQRWGEAILPFQHIQACSRGPWGWR